MNYLIYCFLFRKIDRSAEIVFSGHQNDENQHNATLEKQVQI
jgi:hypothetical protein